jgi:hypothetical protein
MLKKLFLTVSTLFFMGCGEPLLKQTSTPEEVVGTWSSSQLSAKIQGSKFSKACEGLDVDKDGVSMDMIKIKKDGSIYAARKITNTQNLFRKEGSVDWNGAVTLDKKAYRAYFGGLVDTASAQGLTLTPDVRLNAVYLTGRATHIEIKISANLSNGPVIYKQTLPPRYYQMTSEKQEEQLLSKLTQCLED